MHLEGFLAKAPDGRTRVLLREAPSQRSFVDVDPQHVRETRRVEDPEAPFAVWSVHLADEADVTEGQLDGGEFDELFSFAADASDVQPNTWESRPGTTCGIHDTSTRMGFCIE
jgi:hypothetical protein